MRCTDSIIRRHPSFPGEENTSSKTFDGRACHYDCSCEQIWGLQGRTQPAARLSERDLIALMEQHNIGTDATVAEHIQKQLDRGYATKDANLTFWPTPLGEALVGAYRKMGLENLWLPNLRQVLLYCTYFSSCKCMLRSRYTYLPLASVGQLVLQCGLGVRAATYVWLT